MFLTKNKFLTFKNSNTDFSVTKVEQRNIHRTISHLSQQITRHLLDQKNNQLVIQVLPASEAK